MSAQQNEFCLQPGWLTSVRLLVSELSLTINPVSSPFIMRTFYVSASPPAGPCLPSLVLPAFLSLPPDPDPLHLETPFPCFTFQDFLPYGSVPLTLPGPYSSSCLPSKIASLTQPHWGSVLWCPLSESCAEQNKMGPGLGRAPPNCCLALRCGSCTLPRTERRVTPQELGTLSWRAAA